MPFTLPDSAQGQSQGWDTGSSILDFLLGQIAPRDLQSSVMSLVGPFGMAKQESSPLIDMIMGLKSPLPSRGSMIPAIELKNTGRVIKGELGGYHPHGALNTIRNPGPTNFGYMQPGGPFIPENLYSRLKMPGGPESIQNLLGQGIDLNTILSTLNLGSMSR